MKDLKCGLKDCRFNKGYCCCANAISVSSDADCKSYDPQEDKRRSMFEAADEFIKSNYSVDTQVACKANCVFNKDDKCFANGITVMSDAGSDALCLSFIKD